MAGTGVGKFSSTASSNTANMTVNFAENMAPSNVNNAARELMGHMRDMYEQLGDGYFEFGDGDGTYTVARGDADTITITSASDISGIYFAGRKIRITDGGANVVEGTIASSSHSSTTQTVNLTGISLASGTPTKVELGIDTAAFGGRVILDDDGDTYIEAPTDDTIDIYVAGAKDFVITANTFTAESGSTIAAQALTATTVTASGVVDVTDTTDSSDATGDTGALRTEGGASIAKKLFVGTDLDVDGTANLDVVDIDGAVDMASTLQVDGAITSSAGATITVADNSDALTLKTTDADSNVGPVLLFNRDSSSPANNDFLGELTFQGDNNAGETHDYIRMFARILNVADGSEQADFIIKDATGTNIVNMAHTEVVYNDDSVDRDFRVESNGNANMLHVNGGSNLVGIGADPDLGAGLHIKTADSGASVNSGFDELVIEGSGNSGISILSGNTSGGAIIFGDDGDNDIGNIFYDHNVNDMVFNVAATEMLRIDSDNNNLATGGETAGDVGAFGLCLNQGGADGNILTFKSSDVAHSITSVAEADTYGLFKKSGTGDGGIAIVGMNDNGNVAMQIRGLSNGGEDTGKGTGDHGCVRIDAASRSGTSVGTQGSNVNMVTICNNNTVRFIFDAEGDFHADSSSTTFDTYEDAQLVRAYDLSHGKGVIASKFDKFVQYNASDLTDAGLVGKVNNEYNEDGTKANPLINMSGFMRLHNGAIWQQYEKTERLANAMYELAKAAVGEDKANEILKQNEIKLLN